MAILANQGVKISDVNMDLEASDIMAVLVGLQSVMNIGMKSDLTTYLEGLTSNPVRRLREVIEWNDCHAVSADSSWCRMYYLWRRVTLMVTGS